MGIVLGGRDVVGGAEVLGGWVGGVGLEWAGVDWVGGGCAGGAAGGAACAGGDACAVGASWVLEILVAGSWFGPAVGTTVLSLALALIGRASAAVTGAL